MKPIFIPLKTEYFDAFAAGRKGVEIRLYGNRWNEKTCTIGREVVLSKGYGNRSRLSGKICFFVNTHASLLCERDREAVLAVYGKLDVLVALIGIENIRPIRHISETVDA